MNAKRRKYRTSFAPETTAPKRNERDRNRNGNAAKSTKLVDIPSHITVWLQV
jgi:hypothetical protein